MKKLCFIISILFLCIYSVCSQTSSDYKNRGDKAMKEGDYQMAKALYSEGLINCDDFYSIQKLTEIWRTQPEMQRGMRMIIARCRECLLELHKREDTNAMKLLQAYLNEGIGGEKDSIQANIIQQELMALIGYIPATTDNPGVTIDSLTRSAIQQNIHTIPSLKFSEKYTLFLTYTFSPTMPVGINAGIFDRFGVMLGIKSSIQKRPNSEYDCNNSAILGINTNLHPYNFTEKEKWHSTMFTAQVLFPVIPKRLFISAGGGYGKRDLYNNAELYERRTGEKTSDIWCRNTQGSYKGFAAEAGVVYKHKQFIIIGGVNSVSFKDFDGYVGIGYSF